jgi:hypothetical protein
VPHLEERCAHALVSSGVGHEQGNVTPMNRRRVEVNPSALSLTESN